MGIIIGILLLIITVLLSIFSIVDESNIWIILAGISGFITIVYSFVGFIMVVVK